MSYSDESYGLRIELDAKGCELSATEIEKMEYDLDTLRELVEKFPVSNLYITVIHHAKPKDYHVKTSLALCGKTLFTGDRDSQVHPAFERCVRKLVRKVSTFKQRMEGTEEWSKESAGTHRRLKPTGEVNLAELVEAYEQNDYGQFRRGADVYEQGLNEMIGRWIQRYPEIEAQLGETITISDIVEDVFITAFDQFDERPSGSVSPGAWFGTLVDESIKALIQHPEEEFAKISFARAVLNES